VVYIGVGAAGIVQFHKPTSYVLYAATEDGTVPTLGTDQRHRLIMIKCYHSTEILASRYVPNDL
jgi:hypothetical protein